ncbi:aspartate aminotransferase : Aminotransferase, class I and II OS=Planctomyces maris DSM 8797 GN=PM8797T_14147 PE=3 SV=1: Aminotran_1_2 [Gemmata massiliana]|uniref:Aminotransferase class I/classII large domain-containing protein n=1 Tax=Gemmata massiliana TaxID=1210884 RepID=A0A6P2CR05_9BACT|nr:aminotransferase class I/II-fold pyridoxal phosphate-dependent enzyme [Gemmata massiliana]VTR90756.1 aspartate aminotransferase : Aminotransferase, class I and II OS=Planctomyces maris DSM 8797 GN=PM8797T_14147 PE=3 SV=1: Aminotran_1_2 [Gemmata massiliana]
MSTSAPTLSSFASGLTTETAFDVLAVARKLMAGGKDVIALQIGDSPFPTTASAIKAAHAAIDAGLTRYCPSAGLPEFRETIARTVKSEFNIPATADNVVVGPGAKVFETYFCEAFLEPGDAVLVFQPAFPTFEPNILRRGAKPVYVPLKQENQFRPDVAAIERFVKTEPRARALFLNFPHNPTGGVATPEDLKAIANIVRGTNIAVFSDEPYCHMVWGGKHSSILAEPGMLDQCVGSYTFSKSYSMSGWRCGYMIAAPSIAQIVSKMINTSLSCVPPIVQMAGKAALEHDAAERDDVMKKFHAKVELLVNELRKVPDVTVLMPEGTFYVFPQVAPICQRLGITSHGLAMYLLEGADDKRGVACLGGECFGAAGQGFLRFSCAEPDDRLVQAVAFFADAITRTDRVKAYLDANPKYRAK